MRKQDKAIIWPAYFDSNKTRKKGRRVPKNWQCSLPRIAEIEEAAERLGLEHELVPEKGYPRTPWYKGGMLACAEERAKGTADQENCKAVVEDSKRTSKSEVELNFFLLLLLRRTAFMIPCLPGREVTRAEPREVSISAPLVITPRLL